MNLPFVAPESVQPLPSTIDKKGRAYATGRRKTSSAHVWVKPGSGKIMINGKPYTHYFQRLTLQALLLRPFHLLSISGRYDVNCMVKGGGLSGQAGAVTHGISRALESYNPVAFHVPLRHAKLLTRDPRKVERKKYGHRKARRSEQFSKR